MHLHLVQTQRLFIYSQLQIEEALLRTQEGNWCFCNDGSSKAAVLGVSKKIEEDLSFLPPHLPIIKRFSGGGSVYVDDNTLFVSFIFSKKDLPLATPEEIHQWMEAFYRGIFKDSHFRLVENDYTLGHRKCGGNAQYVQKDRFLHHTSFLWDYNVEEMALLSIPKKAPNYRQNRSHQEFLTPLKNHFASKEEFFSKIQTSLAKQFKVQKVELSEAETFCQLPHRKTTSLLTY
jgi:lipoate---protein ligase